jgi:hypothetical protein
LLLGHTPGSGSGSTQAASPPFFLGTKKFLLKN